MKNEKKRSLEPTAIRPLVGAISWLHEGLCQTLQAEAARRALDRDAPIDQVRLASVQAVLLDGEYHPPAELVAEAILDELTDILH